MGWGKTLLFGSWGNRMDMDEAEKRSASTRRRLRLKAKKDLAQDSRLDELESENEKLKLYLSSLSHLLVRKDALEESDLRALADELDQGLVEED